MKGDFSRQTFRPARGYSGVLMQQGRVQLDADWNEEHAIQQYRTQSESVDVIGKTGTPKPGGFGVSIISGGSDLQIGNGHYYVAGLLCENNAPGGSPVRINAQPHLLTQPGSLTNGRYVVYLDVWERHLTNVEDPDFRESTLNGEDTTTRMQTVWQVKAFQFGSVGNQGCEALPANWSPDASTKGSLRAWADLTNTSGGACFMPETGGYRGLENQLYRVEVQTGGTLPAGGTGNTGLVFKWSRENGTVLSAIQAPAGQPQVVGADITLETVGRDDNLGFFAGQIVEATDDVMDLAGEPGALMTIAKDDLRATRQFTLSSSINLQSARHPKLRRWDGQGTIRIDPNGIELEFGVRVQFSAGVYRAGDYWLVPARAVTSANTSTVEWETDGANNGVFLPPQGVQHHYAPLAMINVVGNVFQNGTLADCRQLFPPLTNIMAEDVGYVNQNCQLQGVTTVKEALDVLCATNSQGTCTVTLEPGMNYAQMLAQIGNGEDANICLGIGTFMLDGPLTITGKGRLKITGSGWGTRLVCKGETALLIENCAHATIRDLYAESQTVGTQQGNLRGTISVINTPNALVENVNAQCAPEAFRAGSCIYVRNQPNVANTSARVLHCDLIVGHMQVGVLIINTLRSMVDDNAIRVNEAKPPTRDLVKNAKYRALLRGRILSNIDTSPAPPETPLPATRNAIVRVGNQSIRVYLNPNLAGKNDPNTNWLQDYVNARQPEGIFSPNELRAYVVNEVDKFILNLPVARPDNDAVLVRLWPLINGVFAADRAVASQGITIAGETVEDVRVISNTVNGVLQGVHIGVSHREVQPGTPDQARTVTIEDNSIGVVLPAAATTERHGIFVGNCGSLAIEGNYMTVVRVPIFKTNNPRVIVEGVRVYGAMGRRVTVTENHSVGYDFGVRFSPLSPISKPKPMWAITHNLAEGAQTPILIENYPSSQIIGINENY